MHLTAVDGRFDLLDRDRGRGGWLITCLAINDDDVYLEFQVEILAREARGYGNWRNRER